MRYPYIIGAAVWLGWIISLLLGSGNADAAGHLIGTDFVAFYSAGKILLQGQSADLYNLELAREIQQRLYNIPNDNFNPYLNPPFYAWLFIPFAMLAYPLSPILWMGLNLFMLWVSLKLLNSWYSFPLFLLVLSWQPSFAAISFGQNAFLSLLILSLTYTFWIRDKMWLAGLASGLLLYKPQLLLGIGLLWLLDLPRSWRALLGLVTTGTALVLGSLLYMPEATYQYIVYAQKIAANLMKVEGFPIWNAHGVQAFWLGLFPNIPVISQVFYILCALTGIIIFIRFWRVTQNRKLWFGVAICLMVWITPYLMIYDWVLLIIPGIIFWQEIPSKREQLKVIYAILWVTLFVSTMLTFVQWSFFGRAVQLSIPALCLAFYAIYMLLPIGSQNVIVNPAE